MNRPLAYVLLCVAAALPGTLATGQRAVASPPLDLGRLTGTWYQVARLPDKPEKKCVSDGMILYALNDKPRSFQMGLFCKIKGGDAQSNNSFGKQNKNGTGDLKVSRFLILSTRYEVLAEDPAAAWLVVGSRNHKALWVLSRTPALEPGVRADVERTAAAQGYKTEKLLTVPHTVTTFRAEQTTPDSTGPGHLVVQPPSGKPTTPAAP